MIRNMMSNAGRRAQESQQQNETVTINGVSCRRAFNAKLHFSNHELVMGETKGGLVDGGANGHLLGDDVKILEYVEGAYCDVTGIAGASEDNLAIGLGAAVIETLNDGPIVALIPQGACLGRGKSILSKGQMEKFGVLVDDKSIPNGGRQCIVTMEGYVIPIHVRDGLPRIDMKPADDKALDEYPSVYLSADTAWDPKSLDCEYGEHEEFHDAIMEDPDVKERREQRDPRVDDYGFLRSREDYQTLFKAQDEFIAANAAAEPNDVFYDALEIFGDKEFPHTEDLPMSNWERMVNKLVQAFPNRLRRMFPDLDILKPYFGWASNDKIKTMLDKTTQHYRGVVHHPFRKHFKTRYPGANVFRLNEWMAMDTWFSDVPAADDGIPGHAGATMMQTYLGLKSGYVQLFPMKSEKQIPETFEDAIRKRGAPIGMMSDNAKAELYGRMQDLMRLYEIDDRQSEPHYQHQNPAERKIQDVKKNMDNVMDRVGCPARWWLLAALFVMAITNVLPNSNGEIPYTAVTGQIADISKFMHFHFWQEVFVEVPGKGHKEELARWCFPADNIGDELTYMVLLEDSEQLVARSNVRPARDPLYPNLRKRPKTDDLRAPVRGSNYEVPTPNPKFQVPTSSPAVTGSSGEPTKSGASPVYSIQDHFDVPVNLPRFSPEDLLGLTFLHNTDDGQVVRAKIVKKILDSDAANHQRIKMLVSYDDDKIEEIIGYNELCDLVAEQHDREIAGEHEMFAFREILDHKNVKKGDPNYMGSSTNVLVLWEDGSQTWEPLATMIAADQVTLAAYAKENGLLESPGWKKLRRIARRAKLLKRMMNASKKSQKNNSVRYKFGVRVPRNVKEAKMLDAENGNNYWQEAMDIELAQLHEYDTFKSLGKTARVPAGYQQIQCRMVFDVKQSLKRKARFVARGDQTVVPDDTSYSGVASLRSLRIVCFLAELNGLELTGGDIGNAYLEAFTKEKVCFRAGPEFGELEGCLLIIRKALYGLRTSGARFHAKFSETLRSLGFVPTRGDPDVWIRDGGRCYEYVVVWVDDILTALLDPAKFYEQLRSDPWKYKLKNVEEPKYQLGGDFFRDKDGTLCCGAQTCVKRLVDSCKLLFGELPKECHAPMDKDDKPEFDDTPLLGPDGVRKFQFLIGACEWMVVVCRFDIAHAVMSLGRFRAAPREGHLERLKRLVGYVRKRPNGTIRFRTDIPNHEEMFGEEPVHCDWMETVCGGERPEDIDPEHPVPKGKVVRTTSFVDANLMHDAVTGRSASGIIEFLNNTPVDWLAKRQSQVETATYGSEFMVARQGVERLEDLRYTLRSFGAPVEDTAWMFGDNESCVTSSTIPHSTLSKRWNALSYHKVREAVARGWLRFEHISGKENPADIMTKPLAWFELRVFVEPMLFWKGDAADAPVSGNHSPEGSDAMSGEGQTSADVGTGDGVREWAVVTGTRGSGNRQGSNPIPTGLYDDVLWNNQYGALADGIE